MQSAFLDRKKVDLRIEDRSGPSGRKVRGSYDGSLNVMFLDKGFLLRSARQVSRKVKGDKAVADVLAWKMMPTLAHELSHGMVHEKLDAVLGIPFWYVFLEDEILAYADEGAALRELFRKRGELWEKGMILDTEVYALSLVRAWDRGMPSVERLAKKRYKNRESVFTASRIELVRESQERIRKAEEGLARVPEDKRYFSQLIKDGSPTAAAKLEKVREAERVYRRIQDKEKRRLAVWSSAERFERLRKFYRKEIDERAAWMRSWRAR